MRAPLPLLGALVVALAAVYYVSVYTQAGGAAVNATSLKPGQNATAALEYVPHTLTIYLNASGKYSIRLYAPGVDMAVNGTRVYELFQAAVSGRAAAVLNIEVFNAPPAKPRLEVTVVRTG